MLWIYGLTVMLLVEGREQMAVLPEVSVIQTYHSAMDIWNDVNVVSRG